MQPSNRTEPGQRVVVIQQDERGRDRHAVMTGGRSVSTPAWVGAKQERGVPLIAGRQMVGTRQESDTSRLAPKTVTVIVNPEAMTRASIVAVVGRREVQGSNR